MAWAQSSVIEIMLTMSKVTGQKKMHMGGEPRTMPLLPWQGLGTLRDRIAALMQRQPVLLQCWPPRSLSNKYQSTQTYHLERHSSSLITSVAYRWS